MTVEQRELYNFTEGTEPFKNKIERIALCTYGNARQIVKNLVNDAAGTYCTWYCTSGDNPFTKADINVVFNEICMDLCI